MKLQKSTFYLNHSQIWEPVHRALLEPGPHRLGGDLVQGGLFSLVSY